MKMVGLCVNISGFNMFGQVDSILREFSDIIANIESCRLTKCASNIDGFCNIHFRDINSSKFNLLFSWSYFVIYHGSTLWFCGFIDDNESAFKKLKLPNRLAIVQASCSPCHFVCVTEDGSCWLYDLKIGMWRDLTNVFRAEPSGADVIQVKVLKVCCGATLTAVLTDRGEVYNVPNKLVLPGIKFVDIACGRSHILMVSDKGEVYSAGEGGRGQLGHEDLDTQELPRRVEALSGLTVVSVACGSWHSCAVTADGDLYTWGWNMAGQLGLYSKDPKNNVSVQALPMVVDWPDDADVRVKKVACGARHTIALLDDGSVWGCGWNGYRQLAFANYDDVKSMTKLPTPPHSSFKDILCGPWNSCLVT